MEIDSEVPDKLPIQNTDPVEQIKKRRPKRERKPRRGPYLTSRSSEARSFLDEVKKEYKSGNLMLYEQAVKNLEKFYELEVKAYSDTHFLFFV